MFFRASDSAWENEWADHIKNRSAEKIRQFYLKELNTIFEEINPGFHRIHLWGNRKTAYLAFNTLDTIPLGTVYLKYNHEQKNRIDAFFSLPGQLKNFHDMDQKIDKDPSHKPFHYSPSKPGAIQPDQLPQKLQRLEPNSAQGSGSFYFIERPRTTSSIDFFTTIDSFANIEESPLQEKIRKKSSIEKSRDYLYGYYLALREELKYCYLSSSMVKHVIGPARVLKKINHALKEKKTKKEIDGLIMDFYKKATQSGKGNALQYYASSIAMGLMIGALITGCFFLAGHPYAIGYLCWVATIFLMGTLAINRNAATAKKAQDSGSALSFKL